MIWHNGAGLIVKALQLAQSSETALRRFPIGNDRALIAHGAKARPAMATTDA